MSSMISLQCYFIGFLGGERSSTVTVNRKVVFHAVVDGRRQHWQFLRLGYALL